MLIFQSLIAWLNANAGALQALAGCIGVPGALISLFFIWRQERDQTIVTRGTVHQNITATMIDIDHFFIDHTELRKFFYDGATIDKKDADYMRALGVAEMFLDFAHFVLMHKNEMGDYPWGEWEKYFADIYDNSPILRKFWTQRKDWYGKEIKDVFEAQVKSNG